MLSRFFILRPVLSVVIALIVILAGLLCLPRLEVARFPDISPPTVRCSLTYTGASADTIENSVVQVVEQAMTGLDGLLYFNSRSSSEGEANITFSFEQGVDPDVAQMQVQNRMQNILQKLPQSVRDNGVTVRKSSDDTLENIAFYCDDGSLAQEDVADFVASTVQDPLSRLNGVGEVNQMGSQYAIRIWLDENRLYAYKLNPSDVTDAVTAQNKQLSSGQLGNLPTVYERPLNITITSRTMLKTAADFENLVLKVEENGAAVYLKDVARIELGREKYNVTTNYNGYPASTLSVSLTSGANAVDTSEIVEAYLKRVEDTFPDGIKYAVVYDTVPFVKASIAEVSKTLVEALILVALVILLFLGSLRATLIVCFTIPIVLAATVAVLFFMGYSINTLTLFAMVLSIGLLVDDAIVVVENISRLMHEKDLSPKEAALQSMTEISGALFGVGLVMAAIFVPMSFFEGATGGIYRQFSVTIVSAMLMSIAVALIITPSLCATVLKKPKKAAQPGVPHKRGLFTRIRDGYLKIVDFLLKRLWLAVGIILGVCGGIVLFFRAIPTSFLPIEDQGALMVQAILPSGSPLAKTEAVIAEVENYFRTEEAGNLEAYNSIFGRSMGSLKGQSTAMMYIKLKPWDERPGDANSAQAIQQRANARFKNHSEARINIVLPSTVRGMGSHGFSVQVQNIYGVEHADFVADIDEIVETANQSPLLVNVRADNLPDSPQLKVEIDDKIATSRHLSASTINDNISIAWAGKYVNDFLDRGRIKKVYVMADAEFRTSLSDLNKLWLANSQGQMVPFSAFGKTEFIYGPIQTQRFDGLSAMPLAGEPAPGVSSGQAMAEIARIIREHPHNYGYAWQGVSYQEQLQGSQTAMLFILSAVIVFLCLAALYESWSIPFSVFFVVPFGILGALALVWSRGLVNDVYLQVGIITSGGLAAKNAILLIEYAHQFTKQGKPLMECAAMAAKIRFRPIVMTSVAFLLGVMPLMFASGAGAVRQVAIGTASVGGTFIATLIGTAFIPACYVLVRRIIGKFSKSGAVTDSGAPNSELKTE